MSSNHKALIKQETMETKNETQLGSDSSIVIPSDPNHHHSNIKAENYSVSNPSFYNNEEIDCQTKLTSIITIEPVTVKREVVPNYEDEDKELPESSAQNLQQKYHDTPSICTICNTGFPNSDLFEQHLNTAHKDIRPFPCKICRKRFKTTTLRRTHEEIHNPNRFKGEPQFACDLCDKRYHLRRSLQNHQSVVHKGYKPPPQRKKDELRILHKSRKGTKNLKKRTTKYRRPVKEKKLVCPYCKTRFAYKSHLELHVNLHLKEKKFQCEICSFTFYHPKYLKNHVKTVHKKNSQCTCQICGKVLTNHKNLKYHQTLHVHEREYSRDECTCKICGKVSRNPDKLQYHLKTSHNQDNPFECKYCGNKFKTKKYWIDHQNKHRIKEDKNSAKMLEFKCRICGKSEMTNLEYNKHRHSVHKHIPDQGENEKSFACGVCGQPFFQRIYAVICALAGHDPEQVKAKMFKFQCPECPPEVLGFRNTAAVQKHWEIKHADKIIPAKFKNQLDTKPNAGVLPVYRKNQKLCKEIKQCNGPPDSSVKYDFPLWKDLDLLPFLDEEKPEEKEVKTSTSSVKVENYSMTEPDFQNNEESESQLQLTSIITVEPVTVKQEVIPEYEDYDKLSESSNQNLHKSYHDTDTPSICTICNIGFPNSDLFEQHLNTAHKDIRPFPCKICRKRFKTRTTRRTHEEIHNPNRFKGDPQFACDLCDRRYHLKRSLQYHRKVAHFGLKRPPKRKKDELRILHKSRKGTVNPEFRLPKRPKKEKEKFVCPHCKKSFPCKSHLEHHVNLHLKKETYQCKSCSLTFYHPAYLRTHVKYVHEKVYSKSQCTCKICGKVLANPKELKDHKKLHNPAKLYECEYCGDKFQIKGVWTQHKLNHQIKEDENSTKMFEYKCRFCGKSGMTYFEYKAHRKTAHKYIPDQGDDEKCFACGVCDQPFSQRIQAVICALAGHDPEQVKAKMFKFQCPECPPELLGFRNSSEVQNHWKIEHPDKVLPVRYTTQMYIQPNSSVLPVYKKSRKLCEEIKICNGPPDSSVKYDFPLWKDLDLLPFSEMQRLEERRIKTRNSMRLIKRFDFNKMRCKTVNVNDATAIRDLLGDKMLKLVLKRC